MCKSEIKRKILFAFAWQTPIPMENSKIFKSLSCKLRLLLVDYKLYYKYKRRCFKLFSSRQLWESTFVCKLKIMQPNKRCDNEWFHCRNDTCDDNSSGQMAFIIVSFNDKKEDERNVTSSSQFIGLCIRLQISSVTSHDKNYYSSLPSVLWYFGLFDKHLISF